MVYYYSRSIARLEARGAANWRISARTDSGGRFRPGFPFARHDRPGPRSLRSSSVPASSINSRFVFSLFYSVPCSAWFHARAKPRPCAGPGATAQRLQARFGLFLFSHFGSFLCTEKCCCCVFFCLFPF